MQHIENKKIYKRRNTPLYNIDESKLQHKLQHIREQDRRQIMKERIATHIIFEQSEELSNVIDSLQAAQEALRAEDIQQGMKFQSIIDQLKDAQWKIWNHDFYLDPGRDNPNYQQTVEVF